MERVDRAVPVGISEIRRKIVASSSNRFPVRGADAEAPATAVRSLYPAVESLKEKVFDAGVSMDEFRRQLRRPCLGAQDRPAYHTVAGFVLERLQRLPEIGERFVHDGLLFEVRDMDKFRITRLSVRLIGIAAPPLAEQFDIQDR